jgi:hypothetical protein
MSHKQQEVPQPPISLRLLVARMTYFDPTLPNEIILQEAQKRLTHIRILLEPYITALPQTLQNYVLKHAHELDMNQVKPMARVRLFKFIFLKRSQRTLDSIIKNLSTKIQSTPLSSITKKRRQPETDCEVILYDNMVNVPQDCTKDCNAPLGKKYKAHEAL